MARASTNKIIVIPLKLQTAAEFTALNPILLAGQEGYETDTRKRKVGDGTTHWNDLQYDTAGSGNTGFGNLDGGSAASIYLNSQIIDGGSA